MNRPVPTAMWGMTSQVEGLRWHDPISVVGAEAVGIRNAAHPPFRSPS